MEGLCPDKLCGALQTLLDVYKRQEKGAHGIEERGIYRIHQFEKQEDVYKRQVLY